MQTKQYTPAEVMELGELLTVKRAAELVGQRIITSSKEYEGNQPYTTIFTPERIELQPDGRILLYGDDGSSYHTAYPNYKGWFDEPTFCGSDADRGVFFIVI